MGEAITGTTANLTTRPQRPNEIPALTGLRFLAAFSVLISHALPKIVRFPQAPTWFVLVEGAAAEGMTLFFVLSGFVIFYNYAGAMTSGRGIYNFFVARFARLYPLYALCVAYDLGISFAYQQLPQSTARALPFYLTLTQSWLYHPLGAYSLIFQFGVMPQVSWSISTEWFFYLCFPFVAIALTRLRTPRATLLAAAGLSIVAITIIGILNAHTLRIVQFGLSQFGRIATTNPGTFLQWVLYFSPYVRIFEFLLGCLAAALYVRLTALRRRRRRFDWAER